MNAPPPSTTSASPDRLPGDRPPDRRWLNLGVLAHVDAGKTSLTEALLFAGGAVDRVGRVDDGTTQTDSLTLERLRGITIKTAVATFELGDLTVNLVDTPGHPDFIAEVDRSLAVLDAAVLVVSAVEGVQAQTVVLFRALRRLGVPALIWVNKIDRTGADPDRVVAAIRRRLTSAVLPLGTTTGLGTRSAAFTPTSWEDPEVANAVEAGLAEVDDELLSAWVRRGRPAPAAHLRRSLGRLTRAARMHPALFGSARTGAGVAELVEALRDLMAPEPVPPAVGAPEASGQVFSVDRTSAGERICLVRLRAGSLRVRDRLRLGPDRVATVTALEAYEPGGPVGRSEVVAGQIARVHGLASARIGDRFGPAAGVVAATSFPPPALQTAVSARDPARVGDLHRALVDLADLDPLIRLRPDGCAGQLQISVYGAVQLEVIADTLANDYGIAVTFESLTVICVERPASRASAIRRLGEPGHRYGYTLGVTVEPNIPGAGAAVEVRAEHASLPLHVYGTVEAYRDAVLGYLTAPLAVGPQGWEVTDIRVVVTESGYPPAGPPASEVRHTVGVVVAEAIVRAGTVVCEPVDRFSVETPVKSVAAVLALLARHRAVPESPQIVSEVAVVVGTVPAAEADAIGIGLHTAAHGEAVMESTFDHYRPNRARWSLRTPDR